jgi:hypothetical protein
MSELEDVVTEVIEARPETKFDSTIAIFVALSATFMAVGNIKDGNIVQAMSQLQTKSVSKWAQYQSKSTKQNLAESTASLITAQLDIATSSEAASKLQKRIDAANAEAARYEKEKAEVKKEAESMEAEYEALNIHDDQFDMAEACFTVGIALFGISALTKKRWLLTMAIVLSAIGLILTLSGFIGWSFHPAWLARLLG